MSAKKFEKMIECIVNDDEARAKELFHDIIVEKSRQIYESMMAEDQTMGLIDEIESEEQGMDGMMEADEEFETDEEISGDYDVEGDDEEFDMEDEEFEMDSEEDHHADVGGEEELEDRVIDLEDKLDQLMADFEAQMGSDDEEDMDIDAEDEDEEFEVDAEEDEEDEDEDEVMESIELKKVSVTHGDNGVQTKSTVAANSGAKGMASKPVKFSGDAEPAPKSATKPNNAYSKGETKMGDGSHLKNVDGAYSFSEKGETAPKATKTQPSGTNTRSAVPESKRVLKKRI